VIYRCGLAGDAHAAGGAIAAAMNDMAVAARAEVANNQS
jgi:hypothetical protein